MNLSVTQKLNGATYVTYHSVTMLRRGVQNSCLSMPSVEKELCCMGILCFGRVPLFSIKISLSVCLTFSDDQKLAEVILAVRELGCLLGHK